MKIAFFVNAFPMMSEAFIANSAAALIDQGHSVDIYGIGNVIPTGLSVKSVEKHHLEQRAVNMHWPKSRLARVAGLPGAIDTIVRKNGVAALGRLRPNVYRRSMRDLTAFYQVGAFGGDKEYDILHCQFATLAEGVIKHRKAGFLKGNIVVNFRGYDISETVAAIGPNVYDHVWPEASGYIANCDHFRSKAIELGCPKDRIDVIGSGIRLENFPFEPASHREDDDVRFLMVGRLIERKGFQVALRALAEFSRLTATSIKVDIVGDGVMRAGLEALAKDLGISASVQFHGARTHSEIADYLRRSDVFLAPSMTSARGGQDAPVNTLKEAMALGRPVVGTIHGGIPELVIEGETGVLAAENDVDSLCKAISRIVGQRDNWPQLVRRARAKVEEMYDLNRVTQKLVTFYERTIAREKEKPTA